MNVKNPQWGIEWFLKCFSYDYVTFGGRARRREFWYFTLFSLIVSSLCAGLDVVLGTAIVVNIANSASAHGIFGNIYSIAAFLPSLAVGWRRLHDTGRSGWLQVIPFVPFVVGYPVIFFMALNAQMFSSLALAGVMITMAIASLVALVWLFVLFALNSHPGPNRFGENPKGE